MIAFNVFQGLYYGVRSALFMDVTTPAVAATQFTAYMALSNLVITYTSWWQGLSIVTWGYPVTLVIDSVAGLVVLFLLPFMAARRRRAAAGARTSAGLNFAKLFRGGVDSRPAGTSYLYARPETKGA